MHITLENDRWVLPFEMTITGKGGHGAMPNNAIDPTVAWAAVLQEMSRAAAEHDVALNFLRIDTGTKFNIIPEEVACRGSIAVADRQSPRACVEALRLIAQTTAAAFRCESVIELRQTVQKGDSNGRQN